MKRSAPRPGRLEIHEDVDLEHFRSDGFHLWIAQEDRLHATAQGWTERASLDALYSSGKWVPGGRSPNRLIENAYPGHTLRIRTLRHGGLIGPLLGDRFSHPERILREFRIWKRLAAQGVPLTTAVFATSQRRGPFWTSSLATLERPHAKDGLTWLRESPSENAIGHAAEAIALALRKLHDAGALHGDLNLRNLLLEPEPESDAFRCWLIDLDRARECHPSPAERMREWMRLARSVEKCQLEALLTPALQARVLRRYCDGDPHLRSAMTRALPRERRRTARHRLFWHRS